MFRNRRISVLLIFGCIVLFCLITGCSNEDEGVEYGSFSLQLGEGYDFSTEQVCYPNSNMDILEFADTVDDLDLVIDWSGTIGDTLSNVFNIYGSASYMYWSYPNGDIIKYFFPDGANPSLLCLDEEDFYQVTEVPESGYTILLNNYTTDLSARVEEGSVIAVKTRDNKYAVIEVIKIDLIDGSITLEFNYKYQPDGSRFFE